MTEDFKASRMSHGDKCDVLKWARKVSPTKFLEVNDSLPQCPQELVCWKCCVTECEMHAHT